MGIIPSDRNFRASNPEYSILQLLTVYNNSKKRSDLETQAQQLIERAKINIKASEKVSCLSGGMLQRLLLEREIFENPDILIFCEPLQGLDFEASNKTLELISKLKEQKKIIIVLSSSDFPLEMADFVYRMESGFCKEVMS